MNMTPLFDKRSKFVHYRLRTAVLNNPSSTTRYFENLAVARAPVSSPVRTVSPGDFQCAGSSAAARDSARLLSESR
jgi:hypothetical protein